MHPNLNCITMKNIAHIEVYRISMTVATHYQESAITGITGISVYRDRRMFMYCRTHVNMCTQMCSQLSVAHVNIKHTPTNVEIS